MLERMKCLTEDCKVISSRQTVNKKCVLAICVARCNVTSFNRTGLIVTLMLNTHVHKKRKYRLNLLQQKVDPQPQIGTWRQRASACQLDIGVHGCRVREEPPLA